MSVTRMTLPPRCAGGVRRMMPSGTGSADPVFDAGAEAVVHRPARTGAPGATAAVGSSVSETMQERPAPFTAVTIRRTFPGMSFSYVVEYVVEPATAWGRHMPTVPLGSVAARVCKTSIA